MKAVKRILVFLIVFFASFLLIMIVGVATTPDEQETMPAWVGVALIAIPIP